MAQQLVAEDDESTQMSSPARETQTPQPPGKKIC